MPARTSTSLSSRKKKAKNRKYVAAGGFGEDSHKRDSPIQVSRNEIIRILHYHKSFTHRELAPDVTIRNGLENMNDVTLYGVSDETQEELWEAEVDRLVSAVTDLNTPLCFSGTQDLAQDTKSSYTTMANLANQMLIAMTITMHDC
jgi:hypothetical protein